MRERKNSKLKDFLKAIGKKPFVLSCIGSLAYGYTWLAGRTGRFEVQGQKEFEELIAEHDGGIFVAWHGRALMLPYFWRNTRVMKALVSPHQDGRIIATLLRGYHILSIDGSSDRNAFSAALTITKELEAGTVVSLISDGPRGPRMRLNKSVIYFAAKTGKPIMGFTYSSEGAKVVKKSWDAMLVPKLFKRGVVLATKPLFVPKDADEAEMEVLRKKFEDELNELTFRADSLCGLEKISPGEEKKSKRF